MTVANFSIPVAGLMIVLFGLVMTIASRYSDKATRRFLILIFIVLACFLGSNMLSMASQQFIGNWLITWTAEFFEILSSSLLLPLLALYMMIRCGETPRSPVMYIVDIIWIGFFVLLGYAQMSKSIYYVSTDNVFHRGPLYPVLMIPPVLMMLVMFIALFRRRDKLTRRQFNAFLAYIAIPLISVGLQMLNNGINFIVLGVTIATGLLMIILLLDQTEQAARQQRKIADQQASLTVLQMRPHFVYNTMMSIYYLCEEDPKRAQKVILDFSKYLRKNFTAIASEDPIPFEEELEHAKAYLAVEQVRFEDSLFVEYDTPYKDFELPPLTLQPLVENCVKHGIDPELDPITVTIRTEKTDTGYDVIVADTGPGFGATVITEKTDGNRIALSNIRERLEAVGAELELADREGGGAVVTIHIPDEE